MAKAIHHWINGKEVAGAGPRKGLVFIPATGEQSSEITLATAAEMDAAVKGAQAVAFAWVTVTGLR